RWRGRTKANALMGGVVRKARMRRSEGSRRPRSQPITADAPKWRRLPLTCGRTTGSCRFRGFIPRLRREFRASPDTVRPGPGLREPIGLTRCATFRTESRASENRRSRLRSMRHANADIARRVCFRALVGNRMAFDHVIDRFGDVGGVIAHPLDVL